MAKKQSLSVFKKQDDEQVMFVDYTPEEIEYRNFIIERITSAQIQRDTEHTEFDNMDYLTYYETNAKTGNSYIRPKKNSQDSRIVTGMTQEKENTVLSALLNYNFEPDISAFDKDGFEILSIGEHMEDLVRKSRILEDYDSKRPLILKEALDQGTAFVEEVFIDKWQVKKEIKKLDFSEGVKFKNLKWESKGLEKVYEGCQSRLIPGTGVYLGNIKEFFMHNQPFIVTIESIHYKEAESIYQKWERWDFVPKKIKKTINKDDSVLYRDWTLVEQEENMVEVIKYQDKNSNEYMIILNGVMMLPIKFPLTAISPSGEYTLNKIDIEPISQFFAYSKSFPAKSKVDQEILDDTLRTMILRMRQLLEPPYFNNTNQTLSARIFNAGTITSNVNPDKMRRVLGENDHIGSGEFQVFSLIKDIINEKTANPVISGELAGGNRTAREIVELKKQAMMKLGLVTWGVLMFEKRASWLRLYNILENWTKPIDVKIDEIRGQIIDIYKTIVVDTQDDYGKVKKIFKFDESRAKAITQEQIDAEADMYSNENIKAQVIYIDPKALKSIKYFWQINITPTEKETSELDRVLFEESLTKAKTIFGPMSTNDEYLKQRWAVLIGENPEKFWAKQQPMMAEGGISPEMMAGQAGEGMMQGITAPKKPSVNTLVGG